MPSKLPCLSAMIKIDGAMGTSVATVLIFATRHVSTLTGLTVDLLHGAGAILVLFALLFAIAELARRPMSGLVLVLIAGNAAWVIASIMLLTSSAVAPVTRAHRQEA